MVTSMAISGNSISIGINTSVGIFNAVTAPSARTLAERGLLQIIPISPNKSLGRSLATSDWAAANYYFAKHARDLSPMEAAQLAASLPRPTSWNPASTSRGYWAHVDRVWDRMRGAGYLDRYIPGSAMTPEVILRQQSR